MTEQRSGLTEFLRKIVYWDLRELDRTKHQKFRSLLLFDTMDLLSSLSFLLILILILLKPHIELVY